MSELGGCQNEELQDFEPAYCHRSRPAFCWGDAEKLLDSSICWALLFKLGRFFHSHAQSKHEPTCIVALKYPQWQLAAGVPCWCLECLRLRGLGLGSAGCKFYFNSFTPSVGSNVSGAWVTQMSAARIYSIF